jgi:hypothetical protein
MICIQWHTCPTLKRYKSEQEVYDMINAKFLAELSLWSGNIATESDTCVHMCSPFNLPKQVTDLKLL